MNSYNLPRCESNFLEGYTTSVISQRAFSRCSQVQVLFVWVASSCWWAKWVAARTRMLKSNRQNSRIIAFIQNETLPPMKMHRYNE